MVRPMNGTARRTLVLASLALASACSEKRAVPSSNAPAPTASASELQATEGALEIEVYTDLVCPWCFIGTERLDQVLAARSGGRAVVVRHRAFLLDPNTPPEGIDVEQKLRARLGRDPRELFARVEAMAKESGIPLDLSKQPRQRSTVAAHALLRHAESKGTQRALERALFRAHFLDAANIADPAVLTELAAQHGFTSEEAARIVADPAEQAAVHAEAQAASRRGVRGVPYFVFAGKRTLSGAQSPAALRAAIDEASRE